MKIIIIIIGSMIGGCVSSSNWSYDQQNWAKTNFAEAHNDCQVKARLALGPVQQCAPLAQWSCNLQYNRVHADFMHECMAGQGYIWTEHHIEKINDVIAKLKQSLKKNPNNEDEKQFLENLKIAKKKGYSKVEIWMQNGVGNYKYLD